MKNQLDRLVGMALIAAASDTDGAGLQFTGCTFSAYSTHTSSRPLVSLIGLSVHSVVRTNEDRLVIGFSAGETFTVSLRAQDYDGPEAFSARFADGTWIVE